MPENTHSLRMGKYHYMAGLKFDWIGFDQTRKYALFECCKATESEQVKLEIGCKVIHTSHYDECSLAWPTLQHWKNKYIPIPSIQTTRAVVG